MTYEDTKRKRRILNFFKKVEKKEKKEEKKAKGKKFKNKTKGHF